MIDNALIIDNNFISHLNSAGGETAWDTLLDAHDKIVLTQQVLEEIGQTDYIDDFDNWVKENPDRFIEIDLTDTQVNDFYKADNIQHTKTLVSGDGTGLGDWSIRQAIAESPELKDMDITLGTSDHKLSNEFVHSKSVPTYKGPYDYLNAQVVEGNIDYETYSQFQDNVTQRLDAEIDASKINQSSLSPKLPQNTLSPDEVARFQDMDMSARQYINISDKGIDGFPFDADGTKHVFKHNHGNSVTVLEEGKPVLEISENAKAYFRESMEGAARYSGDFHGGGLPDIQQGGIGGIGDAVDFVKAARVADAATGAAKAAGKVLKAAPAAIGGGAAGLEAMSLDARASELNELGFISDKALTQYRGILTEHVAQGAGDMTIIGGEFVVKGTYETWANAHGLSEAATKDLRPGFLIDTPGQAADAINENIITPAAKDAADLVNDMKEISGVDDPTREMKDELSVDPSGSGFQKFGIPSLGWKDGALDNGVVPDMTPPGHADASVQHASFDEGGGKTEITLDEARAIYADNQPVVLADLNAKAAQGGLSKDEADYAEALDAPVMPVLIDTLEKGGIQSLDVTGQSMDTPRARIDSLVNSGAKAYEGNNLPTPQAEFNAAYDNQYGHNNDNQDYDYEQDDSYGYDLMS